MTGINNASSFARQTLAQLVAQNKAGFQANLPGASAALLRRSNLAVAAIMMAGVNDAQYGYLDWLIQNVLMPDTAVQPYSTRWGALKGAAPNGPTPASGQVAWTGGLAGTTVDAGFLLQLAPGIVFETTGTVTFSAGGTCTGSIFAVNSDGTPLAPTADGSQWNCDAGAILTAVQAQAGVPGTGAVVAAITNGTPAETNAAFVQRYLQLYKAPPQGGDFNDYVEWALEVPGVTRAWSSPLQKGAGTVVVYFMEDVARAAYGGVPQGTNGVASAETRDVAATGDQLAVANWIYYERFSAKGACRPVTALVYAYAPTLVAQNFTLKYVPAAQQSAVEAAIAALLIQEGSAAAVNTQTGAVSGGTVNLADIQAAVRAVQGCSGALITSPTDNIGTSIGQLPSLGVCTFL